MILILQYNKITISGTAGYHDCNNSIGLDSNKLLCIIKCSNKDKRYFEKGRMLYN